MNTDTSEQRVCPRSFAGSPHYMYQPVPGIDLWLCPLEEDAKREAAAKARRKADEWAVKRFKIAVALHADKPLLPGMSWGDLSPAGQAPYLHKADIALNALEG